MDDFPPFFAQQHAGLARLAYLITGDPVAAEDLAAATLVEVRRRWPRAVASGNPVVYARRELIKLTRTWLRRDHRARLRDADVAVVPDVRTALRALPPRRRECVVLRYVFELPDHEVAAIVGLSAGVVRGQVNRGTAQLAELLRGGYQLPVGPGSGR
jgi:DNA-directed RNA polymerase specialized sigma24 family protein